MRGTSGTFLFGAGSESEQAEREGQVRLILSSLEEASGASAPVLVGLTQEGAVLLTWLLDLGAAPDGFPPAGMIRTLAAGRPGVMVMIPPDVASRMRDLVELGAARHRAGLTDPAAMRIH
jgi:hypothetical protein